MNHKSVLVNEVLMHFQESYVSMLDATFGRGGHSLALKKRWPHLKIIALDQDHEAVHWGREHCQLSNYFIYHLNFHYFPEKKNEIFLKHSIQDGLDMILLDLGPSSPQLDQSERGFSFYKDGPLDMRMDQSAPQTAGDIINQAGEEELTQIFKDLGEVRKPRSVVRSILRERKKQKIESTAQLARLIEKAVPWKNKHPATPYFLALRLKVNNELEGLRESLPFLIQSLKDQGRIFVITFHSLEACIVKQIFKQSCLKKEGVLVNKKVIRPSREEVLSNPRSRSAQLRIFQRTCHV